MAKLNILKNVDNGGLLCDMKSRPRYANARFVGEWNAPRVTLVSLISVQAKLKMEELNENPISHNAPTHPNGQQWWAPLYLLKKRLN